VDSGTLFSQVCRSQTSYFLPSYFHKFVAHKLVIFYLVGIRAGFPCSFPNMISHGRSTYDRGRVCRHNRDSYHDIKALSVQMAAWIAKVDNNNNDNNRNNPNRGGEPIPVIRLCNNIPTIVTYRKLKHTCESDLEYYERRYYTKLKDDYCKFEISDSIYRCPFCYNKDYSLTGLLRHAFKIEGNSCSRKMVKDIARHSDLITYILRYHNVNVDEIFSIINNDKTEQKDASVVCTLVSMNDNTSIIDTTSYAKNKRYSDMVGEVSSKQNVYQSASSHGSNPTPQVIESGRCFDVSDKMEVLQIAGMNCSATSTGQIQQRSFNSTMEINNPPLGPFSPPLKPPDPPPKAPDLPITQPSPSSISELSPVILFPPPQPSELKSEPNLSWVTNDNKPPPPPKPPVRSADIKLNISSDENLQNRKILAPKTASEVTLSKTGGCCSSQSCEISNLNEDHKATILMTASAEATIFAAVADCCNETEKASAEQNRSVSVLVESAEAKNMSSFSSDKFEDAHGFSMVKAMHPEDYSHSTISVSHPANIDASID